MGRGRREIALMLLSDFFPLLCIVRSLREAMSVTVVEEEADP